MVGQLHLYRRSEVKILEILDSLGSTIEKQRGWDEEESRQSRTKECTVTN